MVPHTHASGRPGPVLARFDRPRTPERTTLAVFADAHLTAEASGTWKVLHRTEERLRAAVADANRRDVDAVVVAGDLTKDGAPAEYNLADEVLAGLEAPFVAIPGNHDVPKPRWDPYDAPDREAFARRYASGHLPFVERVGGVDLVGLDSASNADGSLGDTHEGEVGPDQRAWLDSVLPDLETPVVAVHHGVSHPSTHAEGFPDSDLYQVGDADAVAALLARHDVPLTLSGHLHWPGVAPLAGGYELVCPAVCSFPQAYVCLHVGPEGTTVELVPLADRAGLEEAYVHAREGAAHGRGVAARADSRLLDELLLAEEAGPPLVQRAGPPKRRATDRADRADHADRVEP
jgi:Icc-related predicted phosphoesterase